MVPFLLCKDSEVFLFLCPSCTLFLLYRHSTTCVILLYFMFLICYIVSFSFSQYSSFIASCIVSLAEHTFHCVSNNQVIYTTYIIVLLLAVRGMHDIVHISFLYRYVGVSHKIIIHYKYLCVQLAHSVQIEIKCDLYVICMEQYNLPMKQCF